MFFKTLVTATLLQAHRLSSHWANTNRDSHCPKDRVTSLCCSSSCRCPRVLQLRVVLWEVAGALWKGWRGLLASHKSCWLCSAEGRLVLQPWVNVHEVQRANRGC